MQPFDFIFWAFDAIINKGFYYCTIYLFSHAYLRIFRLFNKRRFDLYDAFATDDPEKLSLLIPHQEWELETRHKHSKKADDVSCFGISSQKEFVSVTISRRPDSKVHCCLLLQLSNGKTYYLPEEHVVQKEIQESHIYGSARLRMECLAPMRKWRLFFNGILKERSSSGDVENKHVKMAFLITSSSDPFDYECELSLQSLAHYTAENSSSLPPLSFINQIKQTCDGYSQCGMFFGEVEVEGEEVQEVYLWGNRSHYMGLTSNLVGGRFREMLVNAKNGTFVYLNTLNIPKVIPEFNYGFIMRANGEVEAIDECSIENRENSEKIILKSGGFDFTIPIKYEDTEFTYQNQYSSETLTKVITGYVNDMTALGIISVGAIGQPFSSTQVRRNTTGDENTFDSPLCVRISNPICSSEKLSGGKGASLSKLYSYSKNQKHPNAEEFQVPEGIVVTTAAYDLFVTGLLKKSVELFQKTVWNESSDNCSELCERIMKDVIAAPLPNSVIDAVKRELSSVFGSQFTEIKFAVRSSATGEDTEQMSAAGQMDTFLGVKGFEEILNSLKKCWASQFGFVAVQYKRRYGQLLNTPMAVVIQEMIPCDIAGVMFTCDPVSGNPAYIAISSNYGLGESVVAASAEPDTIKLTRNLNNEVQFHSEEVGDKKIKIVMNDSEGIQNIELGEEESSLCSLSTEMSLKLGRIAVEVEEFYGNPRDIEWGIRHNKIFLLQSRPVTSISVPTDFEIVHSTDVHIRREDEYTSKANIGEVMYGTTSTLGLDTMGRCSFVVFPRHSHIKNLFTHSNTSPYFPNGITITFGHAVFILSDAFFKFSETKGKDTSNFTKAMTVAMLGRVLEDEHLFQMAIDRHKTSKSSGSLANAIAMPLLMLFAGYRSRRTAKYMENVQIPFKKDTAEEVFKVLTKEFQIVEKSMVVHLECTIISSMWNMLILTLLSEKRGAWDNEVFGDFAYLLSTCTDVESADVPAAIQHLGYTISQCIKPAEFKQMTVEEALQWLSSTASDAGKQFQNFVKKHGHRGIKEFDVYAKTWDMDYQLLIETLQGIVSENLKDVKHKTLTNTNTIISNLHIKPDFLTRLRLKFMLPNCQSGVRNREFSKSNLIKQFHKIRVTLRYLGKLMVKEGRLPNEDLLFFLTYEEIRLLFVTRSPGLVAKAFRRWKFYPEMDKLVFPEISIGIPKPINLTSQEVIDSPDDLLMTGVPVSQGVRTARACVVLTVKEAVNIKAGDILITYATDIGWSPYFPLLSGVVTELGGLVSHGAVVAREYGLPCVVNLHGATMSFKTGDLVTLDGNKGTLRRLQKAGD